MILGNSSRMFDLIHCFNGVSKIKRERESGMWKAGYVEEKNEKFMGVCQCRLFWAYKGGRFITKIYFPLNFKTFSAHICENVLRLSIFKTVKWLMNGG